MTSEDARYFKEELTRQRSQLLGRTVHRMEPEERVGADGVPDFADYAANKAGADIADQIAGSEANLLEKVGLALDRLEEGVYEQCAGCGGTIPIERLRAKPTVSLCVPCQERKESSVR